MSTCAVGTILDLGGVDWTMDEDGCILVVVAGWGLPGEIDLKARQFSHCAAKCDVAVELLKPLSIGGGQT